eukprot:jgi/Tetstr1/438341/TSEL_026908.t1
MAAAGQQLQPGAGQSRNTPPTTDPTTLRAAAIEFLRSRTSCEAPLMVLHKSLPPGVRPPKKPLKALMKHSNTFISRRVGEQVYVSLVPALCDRSEAAKVSNLKEAALQHLSNTATGVARLSELGQVLPRLGVVKPAAGWLPELQKHPDVFAIELGCTGERFVRISEGDTSFMPAPSHSFTEIGGLREVGLRHLCTAAADRIEISVFAAAMKRAGVQLHGRDGLLKAELGNYPDAFAFESVGSCVYISLADPNLRAARGRFRDAIVGYLSTTASSEVHLADLAQAFPREERPAWVAIYPFVRQRPSTFAVRFVGGHRCGVYVGLSNNTPGGGRTLASEDPPDFVPLCEGDNAGSFACVPERENFDAPAWGDSFRDAVVALVQSTGCGEMELGQLDSALPTQARPVGLLWQALLDHPAFAIRQEGPTCFVSLASGGIQGAYEPGYASEASMQTLGVEPINQDFPPLSSHNGNKRQRVSYDEPETAPRLWQAPPAGGGAQAVAHPDLPPLEPAQGWPLQPRTAGQQAYINMLQTSLLHGGPSIVVVAGPAGGGKTAFAAQAAMQDLYCPTSTTRNIIITRPAVSAGEDLGYLPGGADEKIEPYLRPVMDCLSQVCGKQGLRLLMGRGTVQALPIGFMRGRTFRDTWIIADEMQNSTPAQTKMLLTRLGEGSRLVITGDPCQPDVRQHGDNGLDDLLHRLRQCPPDPGFMQLVELGTQDVQRHPAVQAVLHMYDSTRHAGFAPPPPPSGMSGAGHWS